MLDAASGDVLETSRSARGQARLAAGATGIWVGNREARTIVRIDPRSRKIVQTYGLPSTPERLAVGGTTVWVGNDFSGTISRIVTRFSFLSEPMRLRPGVRGLVAMAATPTELWLGFQDGSVGVFDPATLQERGTLRELGSPSEIALGAGSAWVAQTVSGEITRIARRGVKVETTFTDPQRGTRDRVRRRRPVGGERRAALPLRPQDEHDRCERPGGRAGERDRSRCGHGLGGDERAGYSPRSTRRRRRSSARYDSDTLSPDSRSSTAGSGRRSAPRSYAASRSTRSCARRACGTCSTSSGPACRVP